MTTNSNVGWGAIQIKYTIEDVDYILKTLHANQYNIGKAFNSVWCDRFRKMSREYAPMVLDLILNVEAHIPDGQLHSPREIWDAMMESIHP